MSSAVNRQLGRKRKYTDMLDLSDIYNSYDNERRSISELKYQIIHIEDELRKEREDKQNLYRKINKLEQEIEINKIKRIFDDSGKNKTSENEETSTNEKDGSEIEKIETNYYKTEELERTINDLRLMLNEVNEENKDLNEKLILSESEIKNGKVKVEDYAKSKEELYRYIAENEEKLNKYPQLEQKIEELERTILENQSKDPIRDYPVKMINLQSKCLILEKENEKLKKQCCNIGVLLEESKSLQIQLDSMKKSCEAEPQSQLSNQNLSDDLLDKEDRRKRCLEKEIEILKSRSTKDNELIQELVGNNSFLTEENESMKTILEKQSLLCQEKEALLKISNLQIQRYQKEDECYRKLLSEFSNISMLSGDCCHLLGSLYELYNELDNSVLQYQQENVILTELSEVLTSQIDQTDFNLDSNKQSNSNMYQSQQNNKTMLLQLREEISELTHKLGESERKNKQYAKLEDKSKNNMNDMSIQVEIHDDVFSDDQLKELGFKDGQINPDNIQLAKSMLFYRRLNRIWRQALQQIIGFRIELTNENLLTIQPIANEEKKWIFEFELQLSDNINDESSNLIKSVKVIEDQILINETNWLNHCNQSENREFLIPKFFAQLLLDKIDQIDIKESVHCKDKEINNDDLLKNDLYLSDPEDVIHSSEDSDSHQENVEIVQEHLESGDAIMCTNMDMLTGIIRQARANDLLLIEPVPEAQVEYVTENLENEIVNQSETNEDNASSSYEEINGDEEMYEENSELESSYDDDDNDDDDNDDIYESESDDELFENGYEENPDNEDSRTSNVIRGFVDGEVVNISDSDDDE